MALGLLFLPFVRAGFAQNDSISLDDIVVSANRSQEKKKEISQQVFQIKPGQISFANSRTMAELLSEQGMVAVQKSQQGGGSPMLRGFEASRVLLVVDNVRMNNLIYRAGHLQNVITVSPFSVEKIEVLYGPSSVAYGSDALGGVVYFKTFKPLFSTASALNVFGNATYRYGTANNESSAHASVNIGGNSWASYTSVAFGHFGDLRSGKNTNPFLPDNDSYIHLNYTVDRIDGVDVITPNRHRNQQKRSGYEQVDIMEKLLYKQNEQTMHGLNLQLSTTSDIDRYDRLTEMKGEKPSFAQWYYGPQKRMMAAYTLDLKDRLSADLFNFTAAYQRIQESRMNRKLNKPELGNRIEDVDVATLSADWMKKSGNQRINLGVDGSLNFLNSTAYTKNVDTGETGKLDTRYPGGNNYMHNLDFYANHRWNFTPNFYLNDGLRVGYSALYAQFTDPAFYPFELGGVHQNNFTYSASLGLNYVPCGWKFGLNLSTGYRVPNLDDMGKVFDSSSSDKIVVVPNPKLNPEKTVNIDLNITKFCSDHLTWENIFYATYLFDAIALDSATLNGQTHVDYEGEICRVVSNQNHKKGYILGFSSNLKANFFRYFTVDMAINYTYGRVVEKGKDTPMDHIAPLHGRVGVHFKSGDKKWNAEFFALFNGKKKLSDYNLLGEDNLSYATLLGAQGKGLPAWYTLNLKLGYRINNLIELNAGMENILDTEYRVFASGINSPGRNVYATLKVNY